MKHILETIKDLAQENLTLSFLFVFVISALLTSFVFEPIFDYIKDTLRSKPSLMLNVTEISNLSSKNKLEDFKLLYGTQNGEATLLAAQTNDEKMNKLYGEVATPNELIPCDECVEYSFSLKNIGKTKAYKISLDLLSLSDIAMVNPEKDPKISRINCGGMLNNKGCRLEIGVLSENETVLFTAVSQRPGIRQIECSIDGSSDRCSINFRNYFVQSIRPGLIFEMNGQKIMFPPINQNADFIQYHWVPSQNKWTRDDNQD